MTYKKGQKNFCKTLANVNRCVTFAPATAIDVPLNTDKQTNYERRKFQKIIQKKLVGFEIGCYLCTPQNIGKFIERLVDKEKKRKRNFSKKNFKKHLPVRNKFSTFAPALRNNERRNKEEIHVRRHIELTAVLAEMLEQKNKE